MKLIPLLLCFLGLFALISLIMLGSIAPASVVGQAVFFALGAAVFLFAAHLPFDFWLKIARPLFIIVIVLLLLTFIAGKTTKGSTRWLSFGVGQVQPSQLAKPVLALFLVSLLAAHDFKKSREVLIYFALASLPLALVFIEPDLGTAIMLGVIVAVVTMFSRMPLRWLMLCSGVVVVIGFGLWTFALHDYQRDRVLTFLQPQEDMLGSGYHARQAMIAVGSGKVLGRGLGRGGQSNLQFLPEKQTDFFFAALAEELGLFGTLLVLMVYASFFWVLVRRAFFLEDGAGKLYAFAIISMLFAQMSINIGMNIGLLPITGITLPLLSLGGSSIVSICLALGIFVSAVKRQHTRPLIEFTSFL